jgi:CubicO group peptidase (beta-lactamase class C family)
LSAPGLFAAPRLIAAPTRDLSALTRIDRRAECAPESVGLSERGVERIWSAVENLYRTRTHPAITLVVRKRGKIVLKRAIGALRGNAPGEGGDIEPLQPDAPICLFSATKAITAILVHKLVDDGRLCLDDRVAEYIPEFAAHGKGVVTVRQLLAHRAGVPSLPIKYPDPALLKHWDALVHMLCVAPPADPTFQTQAYHALTGGYIAGELVRRVSGLELNDALQEWLVAPLRLKQMTYGLPESARARSPHNHNTGPRSYWPMNRYLHRILGVPFEMAVDASNDDGYLSSVVPAGNIFASADDVCRVFQMLLDGGELDGVRVLRPETVRDAVQPAGPIRFDHSLLVPIRYSPGFMLGENPVGMFGPRSSQAFGHLGFVSVLAWADPSRELSAALLNTGKSLSPTGALRWAQVVNAIAQVCR